MKPLVFIKLIFVVQTISPSHLSPAVQCSGGQVYQECGHACGSSCSDLQKSWSCDDSSGMGLRICVPGCQCPLGLVQDPQSQCVPVSMCPCVQGDNMYQPGAVIQNSCNTWYVKKKNFGLAMHIFVPISYSLTKILNKLSSLAFWLTLYVLAVYFLIVVESSLAGNVHQTATD